MPAGTVSQKLLEIPAADVMMSVGVLHVLPPSLETLTHIVLGPKSWYVMYTRLWLADWPGGVHAAIHSRSTMNGWWAAHVPVHDLKRLSLRATTGSMPKSGLPPAVVCR